MNTSLFELFKIGIGPSSSHTVGPMRAALRFVHTLDSSNLLDRTAGVVVDLYGSLALTGIGHGTDRAILLGLLGEAPDTVDPAQIEAKLITIRTTGTLSLLGRKTVPFLEPQHLLFHRDQMYPIPGIVSHPNGMRFRAFDEVDALLSEDVFYSIGGGFIVSEAERTSESKISNRTVPYPFRSAADLLATAQQHNLTIAQLLLSNEVALLNDPTILINRPSPASPIEAGNAEEKIKASILTLWQTMQSCTQRGIEIEGILPGGLNVRRRAPRLARRLETEGSKDPLAPMDWVTVYAMAVNEENAAGGRVVTAPTNGAAGVIPAVLRYYRDFCPGAGAAGVQKFFLTAAAIGGLIKRNASISGAEVGCQGEVGSAAAMAAAGLCAALGGSNGQVENAAEIAMEHHLGMTCDPIGGLVQVPCIERNAFGAMKAIGAASLALHGDGTHIVSLDAVIETMRQTGRDMQSKYKETSLGGLAANVAIC